MSGERAHSRQALVLGHRANLRDLWVGLGQDRGQASLDPLAWLDAGLVLPGHGDPYEHGIGQAVQLAQQAGTS